MQAVLRQLRDVGKVAELRVVSVHCVQASAARKDMGIIGGASNNPVATAQAASDVYDNTSAAVHAVKGVPGNDCSRQGCTVMHTIKGVQTQ